MRLLRTAGSLLAVGSMVGAVGSCSSVVGGDAGSAMSVIGNVSCPELQGGAMNANFDANARANATIRAFVTAAGDLAGVAARVEGEVGSACERMGNDLGVTAAERAPKGNENRTQASCNAVAAKIDAILAQGASASVKASVVPPRCDVQAQAEAQCKGQCNAELDPGYVKAHCQPGHLYGRCTGTCSGRCEGTCNGECDGTCAGQAQGQAAAGKAQSSAKGQCAGQCNGTCKGTCSADCHGDCSVDFQEPKCDVAIQAPSASAECESSCKAHANLSAQCSDAKVDVVANVNTGDMPKLLATLRTNLPILLKAELAYGKRIAGDVDALVRTGSQLPSALGTISAHAGACVAAAANATVQAQASIRVSVQASANISAKAGAGGG